MTGCLPFQQLLHRCVGESASPFSWLLHFTLDTYLILLRVKQWGIKCYIITEWFFLLINFVNYILSFGLIGLWTIRLSAGAGAHIEYSSRWRAEDMTITNVIIKTPDRKWTGVWMTSCPEAMGWGQSFEIWLWARPVHMGATGCATCLLRSELRFDSGPGESSRGLGGRCRNSQHSKNCVSLLVSKT